MGTPMQKRWIHQRKEFLMGIVKCNHCGCEFDVETTEKINPFNLPHCDMCLDEWFAKHEPAEQSYYVDGDES
jgi:hypothetical protein